MIACEKPELLDNRTQTLTNPDANPNHYLNRYFTSSRQESAQISITKARRCMVQCYYNYEGRDLARNEEFFKIAVINFLFTNTTVLKKKQLFEGGSAGKF